MLACLRARVRAFGPLNALAGPLLSSHTISTRRQVQAGDCIVAFSKADICSIKQEIEAKTGYVPACVRVHVRTRVCIHSQFIRTCIYPSLPPLPRHKCCMVYGSLPSETRATQAKIFNAPDTGYDVLVASDAIGMGLNLNVK